MADDLFRIRNMQVCEKTNKVQREAIILISCLLHSITLWVNVSRTNMEQDRF